MRWIAWFREMEMKSFKKASFGAPWPRAPACGRQLRPIPITAWLVLRVSTRMPPSLAPSTTRSFGHLSLAACKPRAWSARATATPATSDSAASSRAGRSTRRPSENVTPAPGALCQRRPRRPRTEVCSFRCDQNRVF